MALIVLLPLVISLIAIFLTRQGACSVLPSDFLNSLTFLADNANTWNRMIPVNTFIVILILVTGIELSILSFKTAQWLLKLLRGGTS